MLDIQSRVTIWSIAITFEITYISQANKVLKYFIGKNNTRRRVYMFYSQLRGQTGLLNGFECRLAFQAPCPLIL